MTLTPYSCANYQLPPRQLTCVSPAAGDGVGHAHHLGGEHDRGPELATHKGGQAEPDEQAHNDVADVVLQDGRGCKDVMIRTGSEQLCVASSICWQQVVRKVSRIDSGCFWEHLQCSNGDHFAGKGYTDAQRCSALGGDQPRRTWTKHIPNTKLATHRSRAAKV